MTQDEIKSIVHDVLNEQKNDHDIVVLKTIAAILQSFGIEEEDRKEIRADFQHLRKWRKSVEQAQSYSFKVVVTTIAAGILGAIWLGFQAMLHR